MTIQIENAKWTVNGKTFQQMTYAEKHTLTLYIHLIQKELEDEKHKNQGIKNQ